MISIYWFCEQPFELQMLGSYRLCFHSEMFSRVVKRRSNTLIVLWFFFFPEKVCFSCFHLDKNWHLPLEIFRGLKAEFAVTQVNYRCIALLFCTVSILMFVMLPTALISHTNILFPILKIVRLASEKYFHYVTPKLN